MQLNAAPFFIVGSGRSGTTLLRLILASHSRIAIPPETWFLLPLLRRLDVDRPLTAAEIKEAVGTITGHYRWLDMKMSAINFGERVAQLPHPFLRDIVELIYREHMQRDGKCRWGDKTPGYIEVVPQLARLFPDALFVHLYRDGRDVAKSFQRRGWYGPWLHDNCREWNEAWDYRERLTICQLRDRILDLPYEDLALATERTVRRVCDFLSERFETQMLAWPERAEALLPARERRIHDKIARRPVPTDVYRWHREMTLREIFVCEAFMGRHLARAGYERRFRSRLWRSAFPFIRWYCGALSRISRLPSQARGMLRTTSSFKPAGIGEETHRQS